MPWPWLGHRKWDRSRKSSHYSKVWVSQFQSSERPPASGSVCFLHGRAELQEGNPCTHCPPRGPSLVWLLQPYLQVLGEGSSRHCFPWKGKAGPDFPGPESGLISTEGPRFFSWILPIILWLWRFLYYSGWFLTPFLLCTKVQAPDSCWLLGGTPHKPS